MRQRGFTLLEVMIGLALLGLALIVLIKSAAGSIFNAEQAHMMGVATDLARGKMYDIEETLLKDGFTDTDQSQTDAKPFDDEGWPNIYYAYKVEQVELPNWDQLQAMAQGHAKSMGSAVGSGSASARPRARRSARGWATARRTGRRVPEQRARRDARHDGRWHRRRRRRGGDIRARRAAR